MSNGWRGLLCGLLAVSPLVAGAQVRGDLLGGGGGVVVQPPPDDRVVDRPPADDPGPFSGVTGVPGRAYTVDFHLDARQVTRRARVRFSDGTVARAARRVRHDFGPAMDHRRPTTRFEVSLLDDAGAVVGTTTVDLVSAIALSRRMGFAQAGVEPPMAQAAMCPFRATVTLTNHEAEAVTYGGYLRQLSPCDPREAPFVQSLSLATMVGPGVDPPLEDQRIGRTPGSLRLLPGESRAVDLVLPCSDAADICVASWNFIGRTESGRKAYAAFHAELGRNPYRVEAVGRRDAAFLDALVDGGLVPADTTVIDHDLLDRLEAEGRIANTPNGWEVIP
ncbi:MAG: hypothetical protein KC549_14170 [Myxococcales bacterium]|nr:hypothetical protein [Myxococcales bacterium]